MSGGLGMDVGRRMLALEASVARVEGKLDQVLELLVRFSSTPPIASSSSSSFSQYPSLPTPDATSSLSGASETDFSSSSPLHAAPTVSVLLTSPSDDDEGCFSTHPSSSSSSSSFPEPGLVSDVRTLMLLLRKSGLGGLETVTEEVLDVSEATSSIKEEEVSGGGGVGEGASS